MSIKVFVLCAALMTSTGGVLSQAVLNAAPDRSWTDRFLVKSEELSSTGRNPYFILEPGYQLVFAGTEDGEKAGLTITVLEETKVIDQVETRVIEERETKGGEVVEVSRNFFAISKRTNSVFYFGEEVDIYRGGKVVDHEGAWLSGQDGAKFGLAMPGTVLLGARYYQEIAPQKAMDRGEIVSLEASLETPAGRFTECLKVEETTPLEPDEKEYKLYAAGTGLIQDGALRLVRAGFRKR
jgi:hypothetical protein